MAFTLKLNKSGIACCTLCNCEAQFVYTKDLKNALLFLILVSLFIVLFILAIRFSQLFYTLLLLFSSGVISVLIKNSMNTELQCKNCKRNLFY